MMRLIQALLFMSYVCLGVVNLKHAKHLKNNSEELIPIAWYRKKGWNFYMPEDKKKRNKTIFYRVMLLERVSSIQYGSIGTF